MGTVADLRTDGGTADMSEVTIIIDRDVTGAWRARWPADLVADGGSAGAGRHASRKALIAAIEARGWTVEPSPHGDGRYLARKAA